MNHPSQSSSLYEFLHHLVGINALLCFRLELLDEFISLVLSPLVPHSHKQLLQKITFKEPRFLILLLMFSNNMKCFIELFLNIILPHLLKHNQIDIQVISHLPLSVTPYSIIPSPTYFCLANSLQKSFRSSYDTICPIDIRNYRSYSTSKMPSLFLSKRRKFFSYFSCFSIGIYFSIFSLASASFSQIALSCAICRSAGIFGKLSIRVTFSLVAPPSAISYKSIIQQNTRLIKHGQSYFFEVGRFTLFEMLLLIFLQVTECPLTLVLTITHTSRKNLVDVLHCQCAVQVLPSS